MSNSSVKSTKMTWNSTSSTKSISGSLFGLNPDDKTKILVYRYRGGQSNLEQMTQADLCKELDSRKFLNVGSAQLALD